MGKNNRSEKQITAFFNCPLYICPSPGRNKERRNATKPFLGLMSEVVCSSVVFVIKMRGNGFAACFGRFETVVYRNATNNDTMFNGLLQRKINVFRASDNICKFLY